MSLTGRFAPSPTGPLHLGSLRTALTAWLMARSAGGRFLLRIEDLDPDRSREEHVRGQLAALAALGIHADGEIIRQSAPARQAAYATALARLPVYPCFCTRAEIRAAATAPHATDLPEDAYPGTCRRLPASMRAARLAAGERHALRFDGGGEPVSFTDRLAGPRSYTVDDFVVRRADGVFAYQLAVVVDDAFQGVTQVVRGADLIDSTPRQIVLQRALGYRTPEYAHVPLVLGPDGRRLAKRHGSSGPEQSPLAWLGASLGIPDARNARVAADLVAGFSPALIPRAPVQAPA